MTSFSPTLHLSELVPLLPYWPCRNRWSLSVCSICTSGTCSVQASSMLTRRTWILAVMTVSAIPLSSQLVFVTKTGWMLWIRHPPLMRRLFPSPCITHVLRACWHAMLSTQPQWANSRCLSIVTEFLGTPYQSKLVCDCISQAGQPFFHASTFRNGNF